jgi:hypothetical protein
VNGWTATVQPFFFFAGLCDPPGVSGVTPALRGISFLKQRYAALHF